MAVATPVYMNSDATEEDERLRIDTSRDAEHNAKIREIFMHIIDPGAKIDDFKDEGNSRTFTTIIPVQDQAPAQTAAPVQNIFPVQEEQPAQSVFDAQPAQHVYESSSPVMQGPCLVQDARVTSDLFRAKSTYMEPQAPAASAAAAAAAPQAPAAPFTEPFDYDYGTFEVIGSSVSVPAQQEEENEDLVPTKTTSQYRTRETDAGVIENIGVAHKSTFMLSKRDKILIGSIVGVIVVLFTLIIVNASIIAGLNKSVNEVQADYDATYAQYEQLDEQIQDRYDYLEQNMDQVASDLGMHLENGD